ncbi:phosphoribosylamine/glycine ligase [Gloeomargarita lithophora Alchichica-D10]|uniref:Phosphoribosylamine--glycine ligase n=2 Tax=Gloeomargarita TaxID=1188227 RepID=A0A1J0AH21_9CYAN|nr:phosphoribosylamine--glycine ligase [Gloeomargarita lithophora]APB35242.1 phosphoribosylamine/glycine ligase [Gloeomargarita lithophora Alchichica-D10]
MVVGGGGREHALAWKLAQSPLVTRVFCVPGNGGTATLAKSANMPMLPVDVSGITRFALVQGVGLVVIGPETPLALGMADQMREQGLRVLGPGQTGAQLESSKVWAKELMQAEGIPTAPAQVFRELAPAQSYLEQQPLPVVVKVDGLAGGKGVTVAHTHAEAIQAVEAALGGKFGSAGQQVLVEAFLVGEEVSLLALTDGDTLYPLVPTQDYKRLGAGDTGPNTGGMGACAPVPWMTGELVGRVEREIFTPLLAGLKRRGIDYRGVIYAGLMITPEGDPFVMEFNCRFGDPETQVILPLLDSCLLELSLACAEGRLGQVPVPVWQSGWAATVVIASGGYPGEFIKGYPVRGLDLAEATGALVFHGGTRRERNQTFTDGGRVVHITGCGATLAEALEQSYLGVKQVGFTDAYYRDDIGWQLQGR